jgi:hypothetical protein
VEGYFHIRVFIGNVLHGLLHWLLLREHWLRTVAEHVNDGSLHDWLVLGEDWLAASEHFIEQVASIVDAHHLASIVDWLGDWT